jgi:hypothetical protein
MYCALSCLFSRFLLGWMLLVVLYMLAVINRSHLLSVICTWNAVRKNRYSHMQISVLVYADVVINRIRIPFIYIYIVHVDGLVGYVASRIILGKKKKKKKR